MIDSSVRIERVFIPRTCSLGVRDRFQMTLDRGGASVGNHALTMRDGGLHRQRAKQEYPHAQRREAGDPARPGREAMAEKKRHASQEADNTPEQLQYKFSTHCTAIGIGCATCQDPQRYSRAPDWEMFLAQHRLHHLRCAAERCVELAGVLAARLGHVRPSAARAADHLCKLRDDLARLHAAGQIFRDAND